MNGFKAIVIVFLMVGGLGLAALYWNWTGHRHRAERAAQIHQSEVEQIAHRTDAVRPSARTVSKEPHAETPRAESPRGESPVSMSGASVGSVAAGGPMAAAEIAERVAYFSVPDEETIPRRVAELDDLGQRAQQGDRGAIQVLAALANARTCLNEIAVRKLGEMPAKSPEVVEQIARLTRSADYPCARAAIRALPATVDPARQVALVSGVLTICRTNEVGGVSKIRSTCLEVLGSAKNPAVLPLVDRELAALAMGVETLEYGAELVNVVRVIGTPEGAPILERYAARLAAFRPDNEVTVRYVDSKLADVRAAIQVLGQGRVSVVR